VLDQHIYVDDGYSGGNMYRPAMDALRKAVQTGQIDTVLAYRMDRLSRDLADATMLVGREWRGKATVRSATEDVRPEADEGWLNYSFRAAFADYERRVIRQRTYAGKVRRLQEGFKVAGAAPYGYIRGEKPGVFAIDDEKAEVIRAIFGKCAEENMGLPSLCRWLNEMGHKPPRAAKWAVGNLRPILSNPVYKGRVVFGRQKFLKSNAQEAGPWREMRDPVIDVLAAPGTLPAIVSDELWDLAQAALKRRRVWMEETSGRSLGSARLLTGLIYCKCGGRLSPKSPGKRDRSDYYRCRTNEQVEPCPFNPGYIEIDVLDALVTKELLERLRSKGYRGRVEEGISKQIQSGVGDMAKRRVTLQTQLDDLVGEQSFIDGEYRKQRITIEEARRLRTQMEEERSSLQKEIGEAVAVLADQQREIRERQLALSQIDLADRWDELDTQQRRQLVRQFIRRIDALRVKESREFTMDIEWGFETEMGNELIEVVIPRTRKVRGHKGEV
jgi:site-specific DNA recombinase